MSDIKEESDMLKEWVRQAYEAGADPKQSAVMIDIIAHDIAVHYLNKVIPILERQEIQDDDVAQRRRALKRLTEESQKIDPEAYK